MNEKAEWLKREPREALANKLKLTAWILTAAVLVLVGLMRNPAMHITLPDGWSFKFLPPVHAFLNGSVAVCLVAALACVKQGKIAAHKRWISAAMVLSVLFLLCYVAYHFTSVETKFGDANADGLVSAEEAAAVGSMRYVYLLLLLTHIVLAGVSLPFILLTWISGITNRFHAHRRMAKWVFPLWLYVAVTGPICYFMLKPYY